MSGLGLGELSGLDGERQSVLVFEVPVAVWSHDDVEFVVEGIEPESGALIGILQVDVHSEGAEEPDAVGVSGPMQHDNV